MIIGDVAEASWFFSTLAQSSAAAIGFVIAFAAALYTLRRSRLQERRKALVEDIESFIESHRWIIEDIYDDMYDPTNTSIDDPRTIDGKFYSKEFEEDIKSWAESHNNELEAVGVANLYWALRLMDDIEESARSENVFKHFDLLSYAVNNIEEYRPAFGNRPSYDAFAKEMKQDYDRFATKLYNLKTATEENDVGPVIRKAKALFITGVALPIAFLFTVPETVPILGQFRIGGLGLLLLEVANLAAVGVISWSLFQDLQELMVDDIF